MPLTREPGFVGDEMLGKRRPFAQTQFRVSHFRRRRRVVRKVEGPGPLDPLGKRGMPVLDHHSSPISFPKSPRRTLHAGYFWIQRLHYGVGPDRLSLCKKEIWV